MTMKASLQDFLARQADFASLFSAPLPAMRGAMAETIGEGLEPPPLEQAAAQAVAPACIAQPCADTVTWIRRIVRPAWIDEDALGDWLAIRGGVMGLDGLVGGWQTSLGALQIIATRRRIHVRTRLPVAQAISSAANRIAESAALATQLFAADVEWTARVWQIQALGPLTVASQALPFVADWIESCLIVTDGAAVKYSFLKIVHRQSPPQGGSALRDLSPWFTEPVDS
jgi:hypothetical protein